MSGQRANAAAIQRRTNAPPNPVAAARQPMRPQGQGSQGQQLQRGPGGSQKPQQQQQQQQQQYQQQQPRPKLSVSDAIALTTLRLGRVETFINSLPPLDQIGNSYGGGDSGVSDDSMRVVDEAVFQSIVSRLDKMEQTQTQLLAQKNAGPTADKVKSVTDTLDAFGKELNDLKKMMMTLQNFTMQTNEKLTLLSSASEKKSIDVPVVALAVTTVDDVAVVKEEEEKEVVKEVVVEEACEEIKKIVENEISAANKLAKGSKRKEQLRTVDI